MGWYKQLIPNPNPATIGGVGFESNGKLYKEAPFYIQNNSSLWKDWSCKAGTHPFSNITTLPENLEETVCELLNMGFGRMKNDMENGWDYKGNCMRELGTQLITIFLTMMFVNNAMELGKPMFAKYKQQKEQTSGK